MPGVGYDQRMFYVDGVLAIAQPCGAPRITFPFEGDSHISTLNTVNLVIGTNPTGYKYELVAPFDGSSFCRESFIIEQDFQQHGDFFIPMYLNQTYDIDEWHPNYQGDLPLETAVLVSESPLIDIGGGHVRWTRTWATVPPTRNTYEAFTFTFPRLSPTVYGNTEFGGGFVIDDGSPPITTDVIARVEHRFFLLDNSGGVPAPFSPAFYDQTSPWYIVPEFSPFLVTRSNKQDFVADFDIINGVPVQTITGVAGTLTAKNTIPPKTTNNGSNDPDSGIGYDDMIGVAEICLKSSQIRPWRGNIYEKITLFGIAQ